jgi:hypothetical protein
MLCVEEESASLQPRHQADLAIVGGKLHLEVAWWPIIRRLVDGERRLAGGVAIFSSARVTRRMFTLLYPKDRQVVCACLPKRLSALTARGF